MKMMRLWVIGLRYKEIKTGEKICEAELQISKSRITKSIAVVRSLAYAGPCAGWCMMDDKEAYPYGVCTYLPQ